MKVFVGRCEDENRANNGCVELKSFEQHRLGLRDGREVYFEGERVADVTTRPVLAAGMAFAAIDYRLAEEKEHRELAVCTDPKTGEPYSRFYRIPETAAHSRIPPSFQRFHPVMPSLQRTGSDSF